MFVLLKVVNGGFETGTLSGWTEQNQAGSAGNSFVLSGTEAPLSGLTFPAPPNGTYAAMTDERAASSTILYQDITLAPGEQHVLSLYVSYASDLSIQSPLSLDYTYGIPYPGNQQYRIDLMKPSAPLTSVAASDILKPIFATQTGDPGSEPWTLMVVNISSLAGQTVRLRAAQVDNQAYLNAGLDDVAVTSTPLVRTAHATRVRAHRAILHGAVNPNGGPVDFFFQYGTTKRLRKTTRIGFRASGNTSAKVLTPISGLKPHTTYHFRIVAENAAAVSKGRVHTFTTPA